MNASVAQQHRQPVDLPQRDTIEVHGFRYSFASVIAEKIAKLK